MASLKDAFYIKLAVEGIQKYICSTGKLKEMIGGSEVVDFIAKEEFYGPLLARQNLQRDDECRGVSGHYIVAQENAGTLCMIMPSENSAKEFLKDASEFLLMNFPGLPFYGALVKFAWSNDENGLAAYRAARKEADNIIGEQRNFSPTSQGAPLLPILMPARLDGLPAVERERQGNDVMRGGVRGELISLPSRTRRDPDMLERSRNRLRRLVEAPPGVTLLWKDNLDEMLEGERKKVALICMDGNDLGKLFGRRLQETTGKTLGESLESMKQLSSLIQSCNDGAFAYAAHLIACQEVANRKKANKKVDELIMPLRPLVMGGDDITIIARADVALAFVELFTRKFEELGRDGKLSVGIGMVVMTSSYPFAKAFPLAESLQESAKKMTRDFEPGKRPSSIDYLVLTEEVENNVEDVRERLYVGSEGHGLTTKPFLLTGGKLLEIIETGCNVITLLPRSQIREAWTACRFDRKAVRPLWLNLKENIARGLGGRHGKLMRAEEFAKIFPENFFVRQENGELRTPLGDYLELERLLPNDTEACGRMLALMREGRCDD